MSQKRFPPGRGRPVDVTNAYGVSAAEFADQSSAKTVAQAFTGAKLVKGFNHLVAAVLEQNPAVHDGRRVVFLASDDDGAAAEIGALAEKFGFATVKLGTLTEGGLLVQARGQRLGSADLQGPRQVRLTNTGGEGFDAIPPGMSVASVEEEMGKVRVVFDHDFAPSAARSFIVGTVY